MSNSFGKAAVKTNDANTLPLPRISILWLIPVITLFVGGWMVYHNWVTQGPIIFIHFNNAEGLEQGKTKIKSRNIEVGYVVDIALKEDLSGVIVSARMTQGVQKWLTKDSRFWVVQPTVSLSGVTGLGTLLSGQYIEFSPGNDKAAAKQFDGLNKPPVTPPGTAGLHITLNSGDNFGFKAGDSIFYQGFVVGKIEDIFFNATERMMYYNGFIQAPYHTLVTSNTRFWNATGIHAELTTEGFSLQTAGIASLLSGGIAFGLPDGVTAGEAVRQRAYHYIYPNKTATQEKHYSYSLDYILLLDDTASGLSAGAPVYFRGVKIGEVLRTGLIAEGHSLLDTSVKIPMIVQLYPEPLGMTDTQQGVEQAREELNSWIQKGLYASMRSRNLLLGQLQVELNLPDLPIKKPITFYDNKVVIPVTHQGISEIAGQVATFIGSLNDINIQGIVSNIDQLVSVSTTTMASFKDLTTTGNHLLEGTQVDLLLRNASQMLTNIRDLAATYTDGSANDTEIKNMLSNLSQALSDLQPLLIELSNKPNGLVFTGRMNTDVEPVRKQQ